MKNNIYILSNDFPYNSLYMYIVNTTTTEVFLYNSTWDINTLYKYFDIFLREKYKNTKIHNILWSYYIVYDEI